jgi:MFS superfamily sulfate permease-like transporter
VVITAILGLFDFRSLMRMWRTSRMDFHAAVIATAAVLLLGILHGILIAAIASAILLLIRASQPHVAFLGRVPGTGTFSDMSRHPENTPLPDTVVFRPESSLLYINAELVRDAVLDHIATAPSGVRTVVCDLSASPYVDLTGSRMLHELHGALVTLGITLRIVGARGRVRDLLRADGLDEKVGGLDKTVTIDRIVAT